MKPTSIYTFLLMGLICPDFATAGKPINSCELVHASAQRLCNPDAQPIANLTASDDSAEARARARLDYSTKLVKRSVDCDEARRSCEDECAKAYSLVAGKNAPDSSQMRLLECTEGAIAANGENFSRVTSFAIANAKTYAIQACSLRNGKDGRRKSDFCEDEIQNAAPDRKFSVGILSPAPVPVRGREDVGGPVGKNGRVYGIQLSIQLNGAGAQ